MLQRTSCFNFKQRCSFEPLCLHSFGPLFSQRKLKKRHCCYSPTPRIKVDPTVDVSACMNMSTNYLCARCKSVRTSASVTNPISRTQLAGGLHQMLERSRQRDALPCQMQGVELLLIASCSCPVLIFYRRFCLRHAANDFCVLGCICMFIFYKYSFNSLDSNDFSPTLNLL